ncbi:glycosyltransferase family 2 protein [Algoriphagus aestuarii]|nr:glycosyltransferase family 2 protein [Algoriphagus aestuarii]
MADVVSILIPNYNKAPYLRECLDSVSAQTYSNWECIVVDDHSTDDSWEILKEYAEKDQRFKIIKRPDFLAKGGNVCRNYSLKIAKGEYCIFLDSDDVLADYCLYNRMGQIRKNRNLDFLAFSTALFEKEVYDAQFYWNFPNGNESILSRFLRMDVLWQTSGCIYKTGFLKGLNGLTANRKFWQDYELHLKALLSSSSYLIDFAQEPDVFIRNGDPTSLSRSTPFTGNYEVLVERIEFLEEMYDFAQRLGKALTPSENFSLFSFQYYLILQLWIKHGKFDEFKNKWIIYSQRYGLSPFYVAYGFMKAILFKLNNRIRLKSWHSRRIFKSFPDYYILDKVQIGRHPIRSNF